MAKKKEEKKAEEPKKEKRTAIGKPRKFETAEDFGKAVDSFIDDCIEDDTLIPDDFTLAKHLGISWSLLEDFKGSREATRDKYSAYLQEYKKIEHFREHFWIKTGRENPKLTGLAAFALKQAKNGGWTDKQVVEVPEIKIRVAGGGDLGDIGQ